MKITAVLGSPNKDGNTAALLDAVLEGVRDELQASENGSAAIETMFLAEHRIEYCRGCLSNGAKEFCMSKGRCNINDDMEDLRKKLYESDAVIFASPSYGIQPSARMKNFLTDRIGMFTVYTSSLAGTYFAGISTAGGIGAPKVAKKLAGEYAVGFFGRGYSCGSLGLHVGTGRTADYPKALEKARRLGKKLVKDVRKKKKYRFQRLGDRILTKILIRPIIKKNILKNKDHRMRAVYHNLTQRGLLR
jgi:multimeric flavodoxin WrbA